MLVRSPGSDGSTVMRLPFSLPARLALLVAPAVVKSGRTGFGSTLIEQGVAAQLGGKATLTFAPDGLTCTATWPVR